MNTVRVFLFVTACGALSISSQLLAGAGLPDTVFQNWSGVIEKKTLVDGSFLTEYSAKTPHDKLEGAMLAISFVPRFMCSPILTVRVPHTANMVDSVTDVEVTLDNVRQNIRGFIEQDGDFLSYSVSAPMAEMKRIVKNIDVSSRLSFRVVPQKAIDDEANSGLSDGPDQKSQGIVFSLLGSQRATSAVQKHCTEHRPLPYAPHEIKVGSQ